MRILLMTLLAGWGINLLWTQTLNYILKTFLSTETYYKVYYAIDDFIMPICLLVWFLVWCFFIWATFFRQVKY